MTEVQWQAPSTLNRLLTDIGGEDCIGLVRDRAFGHLMKALGEAASARKLRLFAVALCHRIAEGMFCGETLHALMIAEMMAEGSIAEVKVDGTRDQMDEFLSDEIGRNSWKPPEYLASAVLSCMNSNCSEMVRYVISTTWATSQPARDRVWANATEMRLRDIFGNPFRLVSFSPGWRTSNVVSLAQSMYDSRDFAPMPLLADALQDAGCEHEDILAHCRDANGAHVRGCWVVDLVLEKC